MCDKKCICRKVAWRFSSSAPAAFEMRRWEQMLPATPMRWIGVSAAPPRRWDTLVVLFPLEMRFLAFQPRSRHFFPQDTSVVCCFGLWIAILRALLSTIAQLPNRQTLWIIPDMMFLHLPPKEHPSIPFAWESSQRSTSNREMRRMNKNCPSEWLSLLGRREMKAVTIAPHTPASSFFPEHRDQAKVAKQPQTQKMGSHNKVAAISNYSSRFTSANICTERMCRASI